MSAAAVLSAMSRLRCPKHGGMAGPNCCCPPCCEALQLSPGSPPPGSQPLGGLAICPVEDFAAQLGISVAELYRRANESEVRI